MSIKKKVTFLTILLVGLIVYIEMFIDSNILGIPILNYNNSTSLGDMDNFNTMKRRRDRVMSFCNETKIEKNIHFYDIMRHLIMDRQNKIAWCPVCKAGSTVWMRIFAIIGHELSLDVELPNKHIEVSKLAKKAFPYLGAARTYESLNASRKFMIVRHPFERLLSAFRDKIENVEKGYYQKKYSSHIIKWYRREPNEREVPTFEEFLKYILNERGFDEHWRPYYMECAPCWVQYDIIIKMETFEEDMRYFIKLLNVKSIDEIISKHMRENTNPLGNTNKKITREYFSKIQRKLLEGLYEIYEKDFDLFDYSPEEYLLMAIND